jgi:hypothetical protein
MSRIASTRQDHCSQCGKEVQRSWTSAEIIICMVCRRKRQRTTPADLGWAECRICQRLFEKRRATQVYCSSECRNSRRGWTQKIASPDERGYGKAHRDERARWKPIVERGEAFCCLCGLWIDPSKTWHLDHNEDRTGYRGVAHPSCNVRDGAIRGAKSSNRARPKLQKICPTCIRPFATIYPRQRYCSRECRPKAKGRKPPVCKVEFASCGYCHALFLVRHGRKFCSAACGNAKNLRDKRAAYVPHPVVVDFICLECGGLGFGRPSKIYCSIPCRRRASKRREAGVRLICAA